MNIHPAFPGNGSGCPHKIGLDAACHKHGICPLSPGDANVEFKLSHLVAAEGEAIGIVPLDEDSCYVRGGCQVWLRLQRSRVEPKNHSGNFV